MSERDRMDRARRIRQIREGRRTDDAEPAEDPNADETEDPNADETEDPNADETEDQNADEADGDPKTDEADGDEQAGESGGAMAHVDGAVADAVERVSGASAPVPGPEEMSETATDPVGDADGDATAEPDEGETEAVGMASRAGMGAETTGSEPETRVLEFTLDDEQYCLDIDYIEEIVKREGITRVPNTPGFVEGVVDLRGQITTILNPKVVIETDDQTRGDLLVVFDSEALDEQGHLGWVVDEVRQVSPVRDEEVNDPPVEGDHIQGVIDREDDEEFVVWTSPDLALDEAT